MHSESWMLVVRSSNQKVFLLLEKQHIIYVHSSEGQIIPFMGIQHYVIMLDEYIHV